MSVTAFTPSDALSRAGIIATPQLAGLIALKSYGTALKREPQNALDAYVTGLEILTGLRQAHLAEQSDLHPTLLTRYRRNIRIPQANTAVRTIFKLTHTQWKIAGVPELFASAKPELRAWLKTLMPDSTPPQNALERFYDEIFRGNRNRVPEYLRRLDENLLSSGPITKDGMPRCKEGAKRIIHLLAGKFPEQYRNHSNKLRRWVSSLPSNTSMSFITDSIPDIAHKILDQTYIETGLLLTRFIERCGVSPPSFYFYYNSDNPSQKVSVQYGLQFSRQASQYVWLESAGKYFAATEKLEIINNTRRTAAERQGMDVSIEALRDCIRNDWCSAAAEVMERAAELSPEFTQYSAAVSLVLGSRGNGSNIHYDLGVYRDALRDVSAQFIKAASKHYSPEHLHNKPGSALRRDEIFHQAHWLKGLEIP